MLTGLSVYGQNFSIDKISGARPLKLSGGLNLSGVFTHGLPNTIQSFNYFLSGNLNFNLYNAVNIPVFVNYSDRKISLSQGYSFNQVGLRPSYKWITAHIGTSAMTFSPYTLNGHQFTGGGLELTPNRWRIQVMGGRLLKGQYEDTLVTGPTFKRMGYGYRIEYKPDNFTIGTTLFKAYDVPGSVPEAYRKYHSNMINPHENFILGFHAGATLFSRLQVYADYANSIITRDSTAQEGRFSSLAGIVYKPKVAAESNHAFKARLNYNIPSTQTIVGLGYERIDPNYTTLGGYYFNNDLVNYTLNFSQRFAQGNYSLGGSFGFQKDDLKNTKANGQTRFVANLNAAGKISETLDMSLMFSNFRSYKFLNDTYAQINRIPGEIVDTLNYSMVSTTASYSMVQKLRQTEDRESSVNMNTTYMISQNGYTVEKPEQTHIVNSTLGYTFNFTEKKTALGLSVNYFRNAIPANLMTGVGPLLSLQKAFSDQFTLSAGLSAFKTDGTSSSVTYNSRLNGAWRINSHHRFNFNGAWVKTGMSYWNGNISYNYTF